MTTVGRPLTHMAATARQTTAPSENCTFCTAPNLSVSHRQGTTRPTVQPCLEVRRILILTATYHDWRSTKLWRCPKITHWHRSYWQGRTWLDVWNVTLTDPVSIGRTLMELRNRLRFCIWPFQKVWKILPKYFLLPSTFHTSSSAFCC